MNETMYNNHITPETVQDSNRDDDFYSRDSKQTFGINWSSPEDNRFIVRHRFASPRVLSKSVPRRNKNLIRYKINRSLNFDVGSTNYESTFKSPNSSTESFDGEKQLSRSAKIMRALNCNSSNPLNSEKRKIKKSLNFDLSPGPNGLKTSGRSPQSVLNVILNTPSPKINKTLNFDTSPSDSDASSAVAMSSESIDENQNQTPSRQERKIKKSLNYLSSNLNIGSPKIGVASPMLRSGLKEKIDSIVQISATPKIYLQRPGQVSTRMPIQTASTPRNLYNDFGDDESDRPETPENMFRVIPESMSAIKKSHKKERLSRRAEHAVSQETQLFPDQEDSFTEETKSPSSRQRPLTPPGNDKFPSPTYQVNSIKRSHKKDKSKKRSLVVLSEDECSDTGSIFDYSEVQPNDSMQENVSNEEENIDASKELMNNSSTSVNNDEPRNLSLTSNDCQQFEKDDSEILNDSIEELNGRSCGESSKSLSQQIVNDAVPIITVNDDEPKTPPRKVLPETRGKPVTPENRFNFLQRIATESIKKSHRKVKDENRKKLFKPRSLHNDITMPCDSARPRNKDDRNGENNDINSNNVVNDANGNVMDSENDARACTPENVNSSRLLLSQYSSVKKSHKKDKHINIISKFAKRQKYLRADNESSVNTQGENQASSESSLDGEFGSISDSDCKENNPKITATTTNSNMCKTSLPDKLSPSKRKISLDESFGSNNADELTKSESIDCENAGEEFQIFTPIKKRKSLFVKSKDNTAEDNVNDEVSTNDVSRCLTPIIRHYNANRVHCATPNGGKVDAIQRNGKSVTGTDQEDIISSDNPNGRTTPKNILSTVELLPNIASIKKSHKKDKRGSIFQRTFASDFASPRPSTSRQNVGMQDIETAERIENIPVDKTPPNCLKVKSYIRLLQTTSIKRSHKKVRDMRKSYPVKTEDPDLSDDGSIFGEEEKVDSTETFHVEENERKTDLRESYNLRTMSNCNTKNNKLIKQQSKYRMS